MLGLRSGHLDRRGRSTVPGQVRESWQRRGSSLRGDQESLEQAMPGQRQLLQEFLRSRELLLRGCLLQLCRVHRQGQVSAGQTLDSWPDQMS